MADTPDLDELARRYLDLWQRHLSDLAADGEVAETIAKSIELMNGSAAAFAKMAETGSMGSEEEGDDDKRSRDQPETPGAPPAVLAHGDSNPDVAQFSGRIEELERRIAELESAFGECRGRPFK